MLSNSANNPQKDEVRLRHDTVKMLVLAIQFSRTKNARNRIQDVDAVAWVLAVAVARMHSKRRGPRAAELRRHAIVGSEPSQNRRQKPE